MSFYYDVYEYYKCNNCGRKMYENEPRYRNDKKDFDLCHDCLFKTGIIDSEKYCSYGGLGGIERVSMFEGELISFIKKSEKWYHEMSIKELRNSSKWKELRIEIINRDGNKCSICESKERLHVHHIYKSKNYYDGFFEPKNLITLCFNCHMSTHREIEKVKL